MAVDLDINIDVMKILTWIFLFVALGLIIQGIFVLTAKYNAFKIIDKSTNNLMGWSLIVIGGAMFFFCARSIYKKSKSNSDSSASFKLNINTESKKIKKLKNKKK